MDFCIAHLIFSKLTKQTGKAQGSVTELKDICVECYWMCDVRDLQAVHQKEAENCKDIN